MKPIRQHRFIRWVMFLAGCLALAGTPAARASYSHDPLRPGNSRGDFGIFQPCYSGTELALPECTGAGGGLPASGTFVMHGRPVDVLPDGQTLLFVRARFYDLKHGRWLQRDPLGNVAGPNLYEAFASNPEAVLDPMGTEPELRYEGKLQWEEDGGTGVARIRVYNDGGYLGRSRNVAVFELAVRADMHERGKPRTRAWVTVGSREYLVNIGALRSWLEGLDEQHRAPVVGDPGEEFLAGRLGGSFLEAFGDRIYGILDTTTGRYVPGYDPNDPENVVQRAGEVRQGLRQAAAMGESGMRQVMYGFLLAAGSEVAGRGLQVVSQSRGAATAAGISRSGKEQLSQLSSRITSRTKIAAVEPRIGEVQIIERVRGSLKTCVN